MADVAPFRARARAYRSPIDMLRAMAALDATMVYRRDPDSTYIGYEAPRRHHAEFNAILEASERAGETWRHAYIATVLDLLAIEDSSTEPPLGVAKRLKLRSAFVEKVPESGAEAFRLVISLKDDVLRFDAERPSERWLSAVNRRNDLIRQMQSVAGTEFGVEAAHEAQRFAEERGIDTGAQS